MKGDSFAELIRRVYPRPPHAGLPSDWLDGLPEAPPYVPPPPDPVFETRLAAVVAILEPYLAGLTDGERRGLMEPLEDAVGYIAERAEAPPG